MDMTTVSTDNRPRIEFWFDFGSNYSYLSLMRIEAEAARLGVEVAWRPFLLGPVFKALGWQGSPFLAQPEKLRYVWVDMIRQCRKYGLPWTQPSSFPRNAVLPLRVALLEAEQAWLPEFCRRIMLRNFAEDRDIHTVEAVTEVLEAMNLPAATIIEQAVSEDNKLRLRRQTDEARQRGVFGAPTFFVDGEMYWGNDRMDDALEAAAATRRPVAGEAGVAG